MDYKRYIIGVYESDISYVAEIWNDKISKWKKEGHIIEIETRKVERWRIRPSGDLNLKSKEMSEWGVKALYPLTFVYEVKRII